MKTWITRASLGILATMALALASCEKDEDKVTLSMNAAPKLTASATTADITPDNATSPGATYSWTAADFGYPAAVTYTLQFAPKGNKFATSQDYNLGTGLTKSFTVGELNGIYNSLNCNITSVTPTSLEVRVKASVGDRAQPVYSSVSELLASPYQAQTAPPDTLAVIGSATAKGWDGDTPLTYDFCSRTWTGTVELTAAEFKFRANNSWAVNLGDDGADLALDPNGANIKVAEAGTFDVVLNMNASPKATYKLTKK